MVQSLPCSSQRAGMYFLCFLFFFGMSERSKTNPIKVREKQKLEFASFLFSVFACGGETEPEMGEG